MGLWFDVEKRYNTTINRIINITSKLWFDVEKRYNTTHYKVEKMHSGCGLM